MAETLGSLVDRAISQLAQFSTNQPAYATFNGWVLVGADKVGIKLADIESSRLTNALVELNTEVVYVSDFDPSSVAEEATCPPWFRQQLGTPLDDDVVAGSRATINPIWTRFGVAQQIVAGINALSPSLFAVKETDLESTSTKSNYEIPADVDTVLKVTYENWGPTNQHVTIGTWSLDTKNVDGLRYLQIRPLGVGGRTLRLTYGSKPVVPDPADLATTWASTGLPDSAADLPVLYALYNLAPTADLAKYQSHSIVQSDSNRFVQTGSATAISRRFEEMFRARLEDEKKKLRDLYPPRPHKTLNG